MKHFSFLILAILLVFNAHAKDETPQLLNNVPKDSLMFMLYLNNQQIANAEVLNELIDKWPDAAREFITQCDELSFYIQNFEIYDCLTLNFKRSINFDSLKYIPLINELEMEIENINENFVLLHGEHRIGYIYLGTAYHTIKIYAQNNLYNVALRKQSKELMKLLWSSKYEMNQDIYSKLDSLEKLDKPASEKYFKELILQQKQKMLNGQDLQSHKKCLHIPGKFSNLIGNKPIVLYANTNIIAQLPFLVTKGYSQSMFSSGGYSLLNLLSMSGYKSEKIWGTIEADSDQWVVHSISLKRKPGEKLYYKLDKELLSYLPAKVPDLYTTYNINVVSLKDSFIKHQGYPFIKEKQLGIIKIMLLLADNKTLNSIGNSFVSLDEQEGKTYFKAALKIKNSTKSNLLLKILSNDFRHIVEIGDNCYQFNEPEDFNLVVSGDVWIIGNYPPETLKRQLSDNELKLSYPHLLNNQLRMYLKLENQDLKLRKLDIDNAEVEVNKLSRKYIHTKVVLKEE